MAATPLEDEAVQYLQQYLRIDTTNPPGDTRKAAEFLKSIFDKEGVPAEFWEARPGSGKVNVVARLRGSGKGKSFILLNHMDVVPVDRSRWQVDPFAGEIKEGELWGRGAMDMKGMGILELMAVLRLKREKVPLARDVIFLGVCDEEIGGDQGARWITENRWGELDPAFVLDEGGGGFRDILKPGVMWAPSVAEKKVLWLKLTAHGKSGHGSMPHPNNPNEILTRALANVLQMESPEKETPVGAEIKKRLGPPLLENKFTRAISRNTIALTTLRSGAEGETPKTNTIPSEATATLDIRLLPGEDPDAFLQEIKKRLDDPRIEVEILHKGQEVLPSPWDSLLFNAIESAVRKHFGQAPVVPVILSGATDSRFFRLKGIPSYGFQPYAWGPEELEMIHGDNERIRLAGFRRALPVLYDIVKQVAVTP